MESTRGCRATRIWSACCPRRIVDDLGARVRLVRRRYSSYTPDPATAGRTGLLIGAALDIRAVGAASDEAGFAEFYDAAASSRLGCGRR